MKPQHSGRAMHVDRQPVLQGLLVAVLMLGTTSAVKGRSHGSHEAPEDMSILGDVADSTELQQMQKQMDMLRLKTEREVYDKKLKKMMDDNDAAQREAARLEADVAQLKTYNSKLLSLARETEEGNEERRHEIQLLSEQLENSVSLMRSTADAADSSHFHELDIIKPGYREPAGSLLEISNKRPQAQEPHRSAVADADKQKHLLLLSMIHFQPDDASAVLEDIVHDMSKNNKRLKGNSFIQISSEQVDDSLHSIADDIIGDVSAPEPEVQKPAAPARAQELVQDKSQASAGVQEKAQAPAGVQEKAQEFGARATNFLADNGGVLRSHAETEQTLKESFLESKRVVEQKHQALLEQIQAANATLNSEKRYADRLIAANKLLKEARNNLDSQLKEAGLFMKQMGLVAARKTRVAVQQLETVLRQPTSAENVQQGGTKPTAYQQLMMKFKP